MPGPLDALKKAETISASPSSWQETAQHAIEAAMDGLRGFTGLGDQDPNPGWSANNIGALLGAALPLIPGGKLTNGLRDARLTAVGEEGAYNALRTPTPSINPEEAAYNRLLGKMGGTQGAINQGPHPAITALVDTLGAEPNPPNPLNTLRQEKFTGKVPHRSMIVPPSGFEFPPELSPFPARDEGLVNRYTRERVFDAKSRPIGEEYKSGSGHRTESKVKKAPTPDLNAPIPGFDSKFSGIR